MENEFKKEKTDHGKTSWNTTEGHRQEDIRACASTALGQKEETPVRPQPGDGERRGGNRGCRSRNGLRVSSSSLSAFNLPQRGMCAAILLVSTLLIGPKMRENPMASEKLQNKN